MPTVGLDIELVVVSKDVSPVNMAEFGEQIQETFQKMSSRDDFISLRYRGSLRSATNDEVSFLTSASSSKDLEKMSHSEDGDKYVVYILHAKLAEFLSQPFINQQKQIFIPIGPGKLGKVIPALEDVCGEIFRPSVLSRTFQVVHGAPLNDRELLRSVKFGSSYTLVFTLLVPEPNKVLANWEISAAVDEYLASLKSSLHKLIDLKIKSQVLYYEKLSMDTKKDADGGYNYLTPDDMPHLINPVEARLGSFVDTNPTLNFIVYVPTEKQYPLYLHNHQGEILSTNSFLVPRWGGFYIYNINSTDGPQPVKHQVDLGVVFTQLLPQIRKLLGFTSSNTALLGRTTPSDGSLSQWEVSQWMQQRTIENIGTATHTLYSLSNLVQNIRNMVINDDISKQVTDSVHAILESHQLLNKGSISEAFLASKYALECAGRFAIYIPLFLPVGIPLLTSAIAAIKWLKGKNNVSQGKPKTD
ncbi:PIGS [Bugula neritina]|uniref:PIGS n=1 Tax=Bugula neritina TaxID=10212 RepID=A0A7J7JRY6_BUGNE|nr:PIGS [Bugula neritina]